MWICPVCGAQNSENNNFCQDCGSAVPEIRSGGSRDRRANAVREEAPVYAEAAPKRRSSWWLWTLIVLVLLLCAGLGLYLGVHLWQPATCTEPETCRICGRTRGAPLGHNWNEWVTVTEPTATESGLRTRSCRNDPSHTEMEILPPLGGSDVPPEDPGESTVIVPATPEPTPEPTPVPTEAPAAALTLSELTPLQSSAKGGFFYYSSGRDNQGNSYDNAIGGCIADTDNWVDYPLNGDFKTFSGTVYLNYDFRNETAQHVKLTVYGDGKLLYTSPVITKGLEPQSFSLDVSGVETLRLVIYGNDYLRLSDSLLTRAG